MKLFRIATLLILAALLMPSSIPVVSADDGTTIELAKDFVVDYGTDGLSGFIFLGDVSAIPYQEGDFKNPADYSSKVQPPSVRNIDNASVVTLCTWCRDEGILIEWQVKIKDNQLGSVLGEVIDIGIGDFTPRTEGVLHFPGYLISQELESEPVVQPMSPADPADIQVSDHWVEIRQDPANTETVTISVSGFGATEQVDISITVDTHDIQDASGNPVRIHTNANGDGSVAFTPAQDSYSGRARIEANSPSDDCVLEFENFTDEDRCLTIEEVLEDTATVNSNTVTFHVHYTDQAVDRPPSAYRITPQSLLDAVTNAYEVQCGDWGFDRHLGTEYDADGVLHLYESDGQYDFHGDHGTDAVSGPERVINYAATTQWSFVLQGIDYAGEEVIVGHEHFHGVQCAYNNGDFKWYPYLAYLEGTARFIQTIIDPDAEHESNSLFYEDANRYMANPDQPLDAPYPTGLEYDYCLYWGFLYQHNGGMGTLEQIMEEIRGVGNNIVADLPQAITNVLSSVPGDHDTFAQSIEDFSVAVHKKDFNWNGKDWGQYLNDVEFAWNNWYNPLIPIGGEPYVIDEPSPVNNPWAADYIRVYFTSFGFKLKSVFDGDSDSNFAVHAIHNDVLNSFTLSPGDTWSGTLYTDIPEWIGHVDYIVVRTESGGDGDYQLSVVETQDAEFSIGMGLQWLRAPGRQASDGSWYGGDPAVTSFAVLTMLNWGYGEGDEIVSKGIDYVLSKINHDGSVHNQPYRYTYYTSIAILPLAATGNADYHDEIEKMRDWLVGSQWDESSFYGSVGTGDWRYGGFGYGSGTRPDLSNTQWALAGLKAADRVLGLEANDTYAKAADYFLERCQNADGGSGYVPGSGSIHTMTAASVWSYGMCGRGSSDEALAGIEWLTDDYSLTNNDGNGYWAEYYYKVTLAKALTMTHKVKLGGHDWFEELAQKLADEQLAEGNWPVTGIFGSSEIDTCWAIMALQTRTLPPSGEFGMWATLESHCDLHMYDSLGRHTGVNYLTGIVEENIPGSDFKILDPDGNEVPYSGSTPDDEYRQVIELSELVPGSYRIELVGTSDGPYQLTVVGLSDGDQVTTHTFEGIVEEGDRLATSVTVTSMEGALTLLYEPLIALPVLGVDPAHLEIVSPPGTVAQAAFTVSEIGGEETLHDVTIYCTDIVGVEGSIDGDDVIFDINDFDLDPGASQAVNASIPVPVDFKGPGTGSIIVESIDGGTREITLTLWTTLTATIDFDQDTLNLKAKGKYVTAYIELPTGSDVSQIAVSSISLNGIVPALTKPTDIDDYDNDGIPDLMVKFDASAVKSLLSPGNEVEVTITGEVAGIAFEGTDTIRVIDPTWYSLDISSTTAGSVTVPGEGAFSYKGGTVVNLVATPISSCYHFAYWTGDVGTVANVTAASTTITMNNSYAVLAVFFPPGALQSANTELHQAQTAIICALADADGGSVPLTAPSANTTATWSGEAGTVYVTAGNETFDAADYIYGLFKATYTVNGYGQILGGTCDAPGQWGSCITWDSDSMYWKVA